MKQNSQVRKQHHCSDCGRQIKNCHNKPTPRCWRCWLKWLRANPDKLSYWKGGKVYDKGYVFVLAYEHPNRNPANRVAEHRLRMEEKLQRFLRPDEWVHHLNGIKDDNRPENLVLTTPQEHMHKYHRIATHCKMCGKPGQMRRGYCYNHYERWRAVGFAGDGPAPDKLRRATYA